MNSTFYIVSMEMFRAYKLFSISCRDNTRFKTPEEARSFAYNLCDQIKPMHENIYIETVNEDRSVLYVDEANDKLALHTILTINICEYISTDTIPIFMYRGHMIELLDDSWCISVDEDPIIGFGTLDECLDFIDYSMVTRNNVIRVQGECMTNTPLINNRKPVS